MSIYANTTISFVSTVGVVPPRLMEQPQAFGIIPCFWRHSYVCAWNVANVYIKNTLITSTRYPKIISFIIIKKKHIAMISHHKHIKVWISAKIKFDMKSKRHENLCQCA